MSSAGKVIPKVIICLIALAFWAVGVFMIYAGSVIWYQSNRLEDISNTINALYPAIISIAVGIFLILLGTVGIIACCKENRCVLSCFFSFLLIIVVAEVTGAILGIVFRKKLTDTVKSELQSELMKYDQVNQSPVTEQVDYMQQTFQCCGVTNYTDWATTNWGKSHSNRTVVIPDSCCSGGNCTFNYPQPGDDDFDYLVIVGEDGISKTSNGTAESYYREGCYKKVNDFFYHHFGMIAGVGLSVAVLQVLGLVAVCILLCRSREVPYTRFGEIMGTNEGLRV